MTNMEFEKHMKLLIERELNARMSIEQYFNDVLKGFHSSHEDIDERIESGKPLTKVDVIMFFEVSISSELYKNGPSS